MSFTDYLETTENKTAQPTGFEKYLQEEEDPGYDVLGGVKDIGESIISIPRNVAAKAGEMYLGSEGASVADRSWLTDFIASTKESNRQRVEAPGSEKKLLPGITRRTARGLGENLAYSGATMVPAIGAGAVGSLAGGVGSFVAGAGAGGYASYRMSGYENMMDVLEKANEEKFRTTGQLLTREEEAQIKEEQKGNVKSYGLSEAGPEAIGTSVEVTILKKIAEAATKGHPIGRILMGAVQLFGTELITEAITQNLQHNIEIDEGLQEGKKRSFASIGDIYDSLSEVAPAVVLQTAFMSGGAHAGGKLYDNYKGGKDSKTIQRLASNPDSLQFIPNDILDSNIAYGQELTKKRTKDTELINAVSALEDEKQRRANQPIPEVQPEQPVQTPPMPEQTIVTPEFQPNEWDRSFGIPVTNLPSQFNAERPVSIKAEFQPNEWEKDLGTPNNDLLAVVNNDQTPLNDRYNAAVALTKQDISFALDENVGKVIIDYMAGLSPTVTTTTEAKPNIFPPSVPVTQQGARDIPVQVIQPQPPQPAVTVTPEFQQGEGGWERSFAEEIPKEVPGENQTQMEPQGQAETPEVVQEVKPTKPELAGYEWRTMKGEKYSAYEGGIVPTKISDWDKHEISSGSGKKIVHVYWLKMSDGTLKPYGKQTALKELGISGEQLERRASKYIAEINEQKALVNGYIEELKKRNTFDSPKEAIKWWAHNNRKALMQMSDEDYNKQLAGLRVYKKDAQYIALPTGEYFDKAAKKLGFKYYGNSYGDKTEDTVFPEEQKLSNVIVGNKGRVSTDKGTKVSFQYVLAEADSVNTSHDINLRVNPSYPSEKQNRTERGGVASENHAKEIEANFDPERIGANPLVSDGAPVTDDALNVEQGNLRSIVQKRIYGKGKGSIIKDWLTEHAEDFGFTPDQIKAMDKPILLRQRTSALTSEELQRFIEEGNKPSVGSIGAANEALMDAKKIDKSILVLFRPSADNTLNSSANRPFIKAFFEVTTSPAELGQYMTKGEYNKQATEKLKNALFVKAYEDYDLAVKMAEKEDDNTRRLTSAMIQLAPRIAITKENIKSGDRYPLDISTVIAKAANEITDMRAQGQTLEFWLKQENMFNMTNKDPLAVAIVTTFNAYKNSGKAMAEVLNNYYNGIESFGNPKEKPLFGAEPIPSKKALFEAAVDRTEKDHGKTQISLFEEQPAPSQTPIQEDRGLQQETAKTSKPIIDAGTGREPTATEPAQGESNPGTTVGSNLFLDPTYIYTQLKGLKNNIQEAIPYLRDLGNRLYSEGKTNYFSWYQGMKKSLADLWESFKSQMRGIWDQLKATLKEETGAVKFPFGKHEKDKDGFPKPANPPQVDAPTQQKNAYLRDETTALIRAMKHQLPKNQPYSSWMERLFASPEWYQHPAIQKIVQLFADKRQDFYHKYLNDGNASEVVDASKELRKTDKKAYGILQKIIEYGDTAYQRNKDLPLEEQVASFEKDVRIKFKASDKVIEVWKLHRASYDKYLDLMQQNMKDLIAELEENGLTEDEATKALLKTLRGHLAEMESWRGFYAPRVRDMGEWVIQGYKKAKDGTMEYYRNHRNSRYSAERLRNKLIHEGYVIKPVYEDIKLRESVLGDLSKVDVANAINQAMKKVKGANPELAVTFNDQVLEQVANIIKARGFRSSMIHRQGVEGDVVKGYKDDPIERYIVYANNTSRGLAKADVARLAMEELLGKRNEAGGREGGIDPAKEHRAYEVAKKYIAEQLRNMERSDQIIGLARSIATFKYLGFNMRSAFVNTTSMATTAPAAIKGYVGGNMTSIVKELNVAALDYARHMTSKGFKLKDHNEQEFLTHIQKDEHDNPQMTREFMGDIQSTSGKIWTSLMDAAMKIFGITERWNRGTTMLAAYRMAVKQGQEHNQAMGSAINASNKAHGQYGKATLPEWAWGTAPTAHLGKLIYSYSKFGHNYIQMLYDLGFRKHEIKAFVWAMAAPIVVGGLAALPFKDEIFWLLNFTLRVLGDDRDVEKWFWDTVRRYLGGGELIARYGATGALGVDVSGSLSIGIGIPKGFLDLGGAAGGVINDITLAKHFLDVGKKTRAAEKLLPTGIANPLRAYREQQEGLTTQRGNRIFNEEGRPYIPGGTETGLRGIGFRSAQEGGLSARAQESRQQRNILERMKKNIYEEYRAVFALPEGKRDPAKIEKLKKDVLEFNQRIQKYGILEPPITAQSLARQAKSMMMQNKRQRSLLMEQK